MNHSIDNGPVFTTLTVKLDQGEVIKSEAGAMISMSPTIELEAKTTGKGLGGILKAAMGGESFFSSLYTAKTGPGEVVFAPSVPGDIVAFNLSGTPLMAQGGSYLAGSPDLDLSFQGSLRGMISGEGLFLQKITGNGVVFLNSYGAIYKKTLAQGEHYLVDNGHLVAYEGTINYTLRKAGKSLLGSLATGEGMVCDFVGPGNLWLQTRNMKGLADALAPLLPSKN
jgi:uncharacterized protein (TIGR00266 family)